MKTILKATIAALALVSTLGTPAIAGTFTAEDWLDHHNSGNEDTSFMARIYVMGVARGAQGACHWTGQSSSLNNGALVERFVPYLYAEIEREVEEHRRLFDDDYYTPEQVEEKLIAHRAEQWGYDIEGFVHDFLVSPRSQGGLGYCDDEARMNEIMHRVFTETEKNND